MITRHDLAFMVQEIISECHSRPKGAEMIDLIDKYAAKFGKDNSGMVTLDEEKLFEIISAHNTGNPDRFYNPKAMNEDRELARMIYEKFSQQPPKEPCSHDWQYNSDIKGVAQCSKCDEYQLPKERKVSLEEISKILICLHEVTGEVYLGNITGTSKSILSLLNATEERKGAE